MNPAQDTELMSVFTFDEEDEENSDDEYFPWNLSGRTLQDVESPYDKAVRIQLANRELFSQPDGKKKQPTRVRFNLVPKFIRFDESGNIAEENIEDSISSNSKMQQQRRAKDLYRRRQTPPALLMAPRPSLCEQDGQPPRTPSTGSRQPAPPRQPSNRPSQSK